MLYNEKTVYYAKEGNQNSDGIKKKACTEGRVCMLQKKIDTNKCSICDAVKAEL